MDSPRFRDSTFWTARRSQTWPSDRAQRAASWRRAGVAAAVRTGPFRRTATHPPLHARSLRASSSTPRICTGPLGRHYRLVLLADVTEVDWTVRHYRYSLLYIYIYMIVLFREKKWKAPKVVKWSQIPYILFCAIHQAQSKITARRHSRQPGHAQCGASVKTGASNRKAHGVPPPSLTRSWEFGTASEVWTALQFSLSQSLNHWASSSQPARLPIQPSGGDIVTLGTVSLHPNAEGERRRAILCRNNLVSWFYKWTEEHCLDSVLRAFIF